MLHQLRHGQTVSYIGILSLIHFWTLGLPLALPYYAWIHHCIWIACWAIRHTEDSNHWGDILLFSFFSFPYSLDSPIWTALRNLTLPLAGFGAVSFFLLIVLALRRTSPASNRQDWPEQNSEQPLVHRCRTTHTRRFPKIHAFSYRYLQISIPVGFRGTCGSFISVDTPSSHSWLHVTADDYLQRDSTPTTLEAKLFSYLRRQGVDDGQWHHAYLVTAPRIFGYSFNPVSFWYIYDQTDRLSMMILEVNNTFDERRIYLLKDDFGLSEPDLPPSRFRHSWRKDFHVSPFNSRKGHYSLTCLNAFQNGVFRAPGIDNTIVLSSSKDKVKLVARLFSEAPPIDPRQANVWDKVVLILQWCWMGLFTFPRILKEAFLLFFRRRLHVWLRPEVLPTSIARRYTSAEKSLESFFSIYLARLVQVADCRVEVTYESGLVESLEPMVQLDHSKDESPGPEMLDLRILNPAFFQRVVQYNSLQEVFERECAGANEAKRTVFVSSPRLLASLLKSEAYPSKISGNSRKPKSSEWWLVGLLRNRQAWESSSLSFLDHFVASNYSDAESRLYRRLVIRQLLARRLAFGITGIIGLLDIMFRAVLIYIDGRLLLDPEAVGTVSRGMKTFAPFAIHLWAIAKDL